MKKTKKTLSVTLLMLGLVSIGAGAGYAANNVDAGSVTAQAEIYDWTCTLDALNAKDTSSSSEIYVEAAGEVYQLGTDFPFTLHDDGRVGFALNGEAFTPEMVEVSNDNEVHIKLGFEAQAGDVVTVNGAFSNDDAWMTIDFNNCALEFDGSVWKVPGEGDVPTDPDGVKTYNIGKLDFHVNSSVGGAKDKNDQLYLKRADGEALLSFGWDFVFVDENGDGFKINDEPTLASEIKSTDDGFFWKFDALNAGDVVSIGGTFVCKEKAVKFVIEESLFMWTGSEWETCVALTEYKLGAVKAIVDAAASNGYCTFADGVTLPVSSWDFAFDYVSGNGITVNGEMISMVNSVKSVGNKFFIDLGAAASEGAILKIGGVFKNDAQQVKYVIDDSEFKWDGSAWVSTTATVEEYDIGALTVSKHSVSGVNAQPTFIYLDRADGKALPIQLWSNPFKLESGDGLKLNGEAISFDEMQSSDAGIFLKFAEVKAGDTLSISGTFACPTQAVKYVIAESKFTWNGSGWEIYTPPIEYTTIETGKLTHKDGDASCIYLKRADGENLEIKTTENDLHWTTAFDFEAGSGVGITLNGTQINMNDVKFPGSMYIGLGTTVQAGDVLVVGGTFYSKTLAYKYVIEESEFTWNGSAWETHTAPIEYTTFTMNKLGATDSSTAGVIYAYPLDGDELVKPGDWDNRYSFEAGSGAGLMLNGVALSGWEIKQPGDLYIVLGKDAVAGDEFTIDGTFYNEVTAKKYLFNNCTLVFDGTVWAAKEEVVEYTTFTMNKLGATASSTAGVIYAYPLDGDELVKPGDWDNRYSFEAGSGAGLMLNGVALSGWEIKQPGDLYIVLGKDAVAGDEFTIDGIFYNEVAAKKYVFNNCTLVFDGTVWAAKAEEPPVNPEDPEIEYTEYTLGAVTKISDGQVSGAYFVFGDGVTLPVSSWDFAFDYVSGNGITIDGVMISMDNSVKSVGNKFYANFGGNVASKGTILKIGGVFKNDAQKVKYIIEDSEFKWNGFEWVDPSEPDIPDEPTAYEIGTLQFHVNTRVGGASADNSVLYLERVDGEALPLLTWDFVFVYESGDGFKVNGEAVTPVAIKSTGDGFYWNFAPLNAGDVVSISGAFICEAKAMKYVIEESKFVWNGSGWEYYTEYTTHDVGSVVFESGSAQELYLIRADGEAFEIVSTEDDINWKAPFAIRAGSGVGIKLNGVQISMENSVKFPAQMYIDLGAAAQVGDMLEIGGTFYNVDLGVEYVIAESVLIFNGEAWTDYLTSAKDSAKTQLDKYLAANFSQDNYYEEQWAEMAAIVENAKASIDKAKTEADLAPIVEKAKEDFGTVLLKDAVDVLLTEVKANAKADLAAYKEKANYNDAEWATIEGILADANAKIDAVHSEAAVAEAVAEAKAAMDKVLTAEQATAAQLKAWREEATKEVQAYYSALDFKLYSSEENATLTGYLQTALATIESATAKEDIDGAVAQFKASVDSMKKTSTDDSASQDDTVAEEDILTKIKKMVGCESVVGSSVALSGIGLAAAAVVALRKKEDNE